MHSALCCRTLLSPRPDQRRDQAPVSEIRVGLMIGRASRRGGAMPTELIDLEDSLRIRRILRFCDVVSEHAMPLISIGHVANWVPHQSIGVGFRALD
jgi:hypothetical protein